MKEFPDLPLNKGYKYPLIVTDLFKIDNSGL